MENSPSKAKLDPLVNKHLRNKSSMLLLIKSPSRNNNSFIGGNPAAATLTATRESVLNLKTQKIPDINKTVSYSNNNMYLPNILSDHSSFKPVKL